MNAALQWRCLATLAGKESLMLGTSGIVYYKVAVKGLAAHAGANPELGVNALVEATPISGPARIGNTASASRAMVDSFTFTTAPIVSPFSLQ